MLGCKKFPGGPTGSHARGLRNTNGDYLYEFYVEANLAAANNLVKHKACNITTWEDRKTDRERNKTSRPTKEEPGDPILVEMKKKKALKRERKWRRANQRNWQTQRKTVIELTMLSKRGRHIFLKRTCLMKKMR